MPSDHGPRAATNDSTVPPRREVALFTMSHSRDTSTMAQADTPGTAAPFGSVLADHMTIASYAQGAWSAPRLGPVEPLEMHPAAHALHYGSACFEGLKAHRGVDGVVRIFRLDRHVERLRRSAGSMHLPVPPTDLVTAMIRDVVVAALDDVPEPPGSLYIRPTLLGTAPDIGAAARPSPDATLYVLVSPVGDYFAAGERALTVAIETDAIRTPARFGTVKAGANYALALGVTLAARTENGADQVLFAPTGFVEETGASNIVLLDSTTVITPALRPSFLDGVTRDSLLHVARDQGLRVSERDLTVDELVERARRPTAELALVGTAAIVAGVGELVRGSERIPVGSGEVGSVTRELRSRLVAIQQGAVADPGGWLTPVG